MLDIIAPICDFMHGTMFTLGWGQCRIWSLSYWQSMPTVYI